MEGFDRDERVFVDGEAVIEIPNYQRIDQVQFRQQQRQQTKRMHGSQSVGGIRLQERFLQVEPKLSASRRRGSQGGKRLLDAKFRRSTQAESMVRHKVEEAQQHFGILQSRRLLKEDQPVDDGEIGGGEARTPALHLA